MNPIASTPSPPYYAVVFTSLRTDADSDGYATTAERMVQLASEQPGFLGVESARGADGVGITVSYWDSLESIRRWHEHAEHRLAQRDGKAKWYARYQLRVCRVEQAYGFENARAKE
jgi:heme-degrading monooxygenase HmoA